MNRLWSYPDYVNYLSHPNSFIRKWAFKAIEQQYPRRITKEIVQLIGDSDQYLACMAPKYLAGHGVFECGPAIMESFLKDDPMVASNCAIALGMLRYEPAFDKVVEQLRTVDNSEIFLGILHYLGCIRQDASHEILEAVFAQSLESQHADAIAENLLAHHVPTDVPVILDALFALGRDNFQLNSFIRSLMSSVNARKFYDDLTEYGGQNVLEAPQTVLEDMVAQYPGLHMDGELKADIVDKIKRTRYQELATALLFKAQQTVTARFPEARASEFLSEIFEIDNLSLTILEGIAKNFSKWKSADTKEDFVRKIVSVILASFFGIQCRQNYIKALDPDASVDELLAALKAAGEAFPEKIQKRLIALAPIERLKTALSEDLSTWGDIWTVRLMGRIGDKAFVPDLIRILKMDDYLSFIYSDAINALHGIKEDGYAQIFAAINDGELTDPMAIASLLENLPYAESFDIAYHLYNDEKAEDNLDSYEVYATCLQGIGDKRGIAALQEIFHEGNAVYIGDSLEALSLLYTQNIPELDIIQKKRKESLERQKQRRKELGELGRKATKNRMITNSGYRKGNVSTFKREKPKIGRNAPCLCGSGKKYKNVV